MKVIVGEEIMTAHGEIIGLYLTKTIQPGLDCKATIQAIKAQGGVVYVPHPYDEKRARTVLQECDITKYREYIDCIECHNGRNKSPDYSQRQDEIADRYGITKVIGSDAHTVFEIGRNYMTVSVEPSSADEFRSAISTAQFHKKKCIQFCHVLTRIARVINYVREGSWGELYRIVHAKLTG